MFSVQKLSELKLEVGVQFGLASKWLSKGGPIFSSVNGRFTQPCQEKGASVS
jgi:hypothetical protein